MTLSLRLTIAILFAAAGTACSHSGPPASGPPASGAPTTVAHPAVKYEPGPCPTLPHPAPELQRAQCATLVVPENRTKPGGRTLRLAVAVIPAQTQPAAPDPIVFVTGGPGEDAIMDPPIAQDVDLNRNRDLILLAQRGNHSSQPALTCPEIDNFFSRRVGLVYDAPGTGAEYVQAAKTCHDRLAGTADLAAFNSTESAYDLVDLRNALHVTQWNLFSHSYGTDLALIYSRLDGPAIRSLVLDGMTPPSIASPSWTWSSAREAFDNMMSACTVQPDCQARYPNLGDTFVRLVNELEAHPVTTSVNVEGAGDTKIVLDGGALLNWFVPMATHLPAEMPAAIDELAHGNPTRTAKQWAMAWVNPAKVGVMGWGLTLSIWCSEWVPFDSAEDQNRAARQVFAALPDSVRAQAPQLPFLRQACQAWNVPKASDWVRGISDATMPALALSGSYDGQTGAASGQYVAQRLPHAISVTVPGAAHGIYADPCGAAVIASFFNDPQRPDTSCVGRTLPPTFAVNPPPP
ncbi:alpha/beta fold hydrolase [Mycobacterium asiaticum]|uniref:Hydrolase n=1 Tax=Mycobacterium asiaticum TaxID=1790 RepID=A0A1A3MVD2_MYCAS|nr:alpha/beta hydrolase [Mycobacterium asiaticum]OBK13858.1 hydrolase [Mycobacterium asiaticum]